MIRLAHFSDIHITTTPLGWSWPDLASRRLTSWFNLQALGRGKRFQEADAVLAAMVRDIRTRAPDHLVFSGDATALGFRSEIEKAAQILEVDRLPGLAVPGNHDYCTPRAARSGDFERCFAPWQTGERIGDATYPFAQRVGEYWLVAVNSARGNRWFWDARGYVTADECARLEQLLAKLSAGPRILVTHYPVCLSDGKPESKSHRLINLRVVLDMAARSGVSLWLHGHRHGFYAHQAVEGAPFPVICVGSATQTGCWSYGEYELEGVNLRGQQRLYDPERNDFNDKRAFHLTLR